MFKKGMLLYAKKVDDAKLGHQVTVTARVYLGRVENVVYDNQFMPVPAEFQPLVGKSPDEIKAQGFTLDRAVIEDDGLPEPVDPEHVDLFENSDILERPTVFVDLNWRFYDAIVAVDQASDEDERINALLALGEAVYFAALEEEDEE